MNVRNYNVDIEGVRYPRDADSIGYNFNDYIDQNRDPKLFYKEQVGEELLNPVLENTDVRKNFSIQDIDLSFQVDHFIP